MNNNVEHVKSIFEKIREYGLKLTEEKSELFLKNNYILEPNVK